MANNDTDLLAVVLDEIALEGLDGITLDSLWIRLAVRFAQSVGRPALDASLPAVQTFIFEHIVKSLATDRSVLMYVLPTERPTIVLYNRYDNVNEDTGTIVENPDLIADDVYGEVSPVTDPEIKGSSRDYYDRKNVSKEVLTQAMSMQNIDRTYGRLKFVLVANQSVRTRALMGSYCEADIDLTAIQYCILERIGRQRYLGEITVGKESGDYKFSPKTLFYYRKVLFRKRLIKKKQCILFNAKTVQNSHGLVLTLSRFVIDTLSVVEINAQKVSDLLAAAPDGQLDYDFVRTQLDMTKARYFRDLMASYSTHFQVIQTSTVKEGSSSSSSTSLKRIIRLIRPIGRTVDAMDDDEPGEDDDEEMTIGGSAGKQQSLVVFSAGKILVDRPLLSQALEVIESHESQDGISLNEVGRCLSLPKLEVRALVRQLERVGAISTVMVDRGRQKVTLYIPKYRPSDPNTAFSRSRKSLKSLPENSSSANLLQRANTILECVQKDRLVDRIFTLKQLIREAERNKLHKICTKTVVRVVHKLAADGLVRSIRTILRYQDQVKKLHFVCVPEITPENPIVKDRINQIKFQWISKFCADIQSDRSNIKPSTTDPQKPHKVVMNLVYQPSIARKYGLEPKLKKMLTLYRFLFYLTYDFDRQNIPDTDWRYNIEPLPDGQQTKTCTIGEIVPRLPVSIFVKIIWISFIIPGLQELIDDPVVINQTLSQISPYIRQCLLYKRKFAFNICESLVGLSYMGLVDTQYREQTEKETTIITVHNKFSLVVNGCQTDYEFNSMKDLQDFEEVLQMHCFEPCEDCSLDKRLFAHNSRNWTYTPAYKAKSLSASNRLIRLSGNNESIDTNVGKENNTKTPTTKSAKKRKKETSLPKAQTKEITKTGRKKAKALSAAPTTAAATPTTTAAATPTPPAVRKSPTAKKVRKRKRAYDDIDMKAKGFMKKQRTDWTPDEDSYLLICKVASALLDPNCSSHICVNRNVVRDELHKYYPQVSKDKTALACQRRINYMLKNPKTRQNVSDYIGEFNQELTIAMPSVPKTHEEVWSDAYRNTLNQILTRMQSSQSINTQTAITIQSMADLLSRFKIIKSPTHLLPIRGPIHEEPHNVVDIHVNVVTNVLLSSLLSKYYMNATNVDNKVDSNVFAQTLFRIYHRYPDSLIRSVVTRLGKYGYMTKVKKTIDLSTIKSKGNTPYRISQNFLYLFQTKYYLENLLKDQSLDTSEPIGIKEGKTGFEAAIVSSLLTTRAVRFYTNIPDSVVELQKDCPLVPKTARDVVVNAKDPRASSRYALHLLRQHMTINPNDRTKHSADYLYVNQCRITAVATDDFDFNCQQFDRLFKRQTQLFLNDIMSVSSAPVADRPLVDYIKSKKELGASEDELTSFYATKDLLSDTLWRLNDRKIVFRVGVRTFRWVFISFVNPWLVHSHASPVADQSADSDPSDANKNNNKLTKTPVKFFARYWKQPNGSVDNKVVFRFLSAILGHIMCYQCLPESALIEFFCQTLQPVQLLEIIELLKCAKCVDTIDCKPILKPKLFGPKVTLNPTDKPIVHFISTPDCIIRLSRLKDYLKI